MLENKMLILLGIILFTTSNLFGQLTWTPEKVTAGDQVTLSYNPQGTPLENEEVIIISLYQFDDKSVEGEEVIVKYSEGKYTGIFQVKSTTKAMLFGVSNENMDVFDSKDKEGYQMICYKGDRKTPENGAYAAQSKIVCDYIEIAGGERDQKKGFQLLDKEFKLHPGYAKNFDLQNYHLGIAIVNEEEAAIKEHENLANEILAKKNPSESELEYAYSFISRVKKDEKAAEVLKNKIIESYPSNYHAIGKYTKKVKSAETISEKIAVLEDWTKTFGDKRKSTKDFILSKIIQAYDKAGDWGNFQKYLNMVNDPTRQASILNSVAWRMSGESIEADAKNAIQGLQFSKQSLELLETEMKEMTAKSKLFTPRQYLRRIKYSFSNYADTYALLAYKNNQPEEALKFQTIACEQSDFENGDLNEKYCVYSEKVNGAKETESMIANLMAKGKATSKMKEQHKRLFITNNSLETAYEKYVHQLEQSANALMRAKIKKEMINKPFPNYSLVNLKGEKVNSEDLKGKVVVVDFWATWCGPCIASFPAMQKAVDKFAKSEDVIFVFIDTWESGDDDKVTTKVSEFISTNKYSFDVLMDLDSKVVSSFGVSGIPTKFVIDKNGVIKFKSSGYNGNDDDLVNELSIMIELAGGTIPTSVPGAP